MNLSVLYDMRNPREDRRYETLYREVLEQSAVVQELGFDAVWVTEHHSTDDGYCPSPLVLLAAIAQRAPGLPLGTNILLSPLHHPLRVAEDVATLCLIAEGGFTLGIGGGYSEIEFKSFGISMRNRPSLMTESVEVYRRALAGERFSFQGKRFHLDQARVTPVTHNPPRILIGALSEPGCDRAVAIADGYMGAWEASLDLYADALERAGQTRTDGTIGGVPVWWVIAEDPEKEWAKVGDHALYQINKYADWGSFPQHFEHRDQLLEAGVWEAMDGPTAVDRLVALSERFPQLEDVHVFAALPGEDIANATERLSYIAEHVGTVVRERTAVRA